MSRSAVRGREPGRRRRGSLPAAAPALLLAAALGGCEPAPRSGAALADSPQVALLTSGPVSDAGWYAGAYEGLLMLRDSLGVAVSHQQTRTPAEFDEAFVAYADAGFDLIFAHGFEYQDAAIRAGGRHPELTIVVSGGGRVSDNVVPLIFTLEEASYLAGMAAAGMSRTGVVGMVGGVEIPPVQGTFRAFEAGARALDPDVRVLETFIGTWDDVAAAKEAAVAQLRRGADVLIHNTDAASFGVFQAVREARSGGAGPWIIGMNRDQNDIAPEVTLGSAVIRIPEAFLTVARRWRAEGLEGAPVYAGLEGSVVDWVVNPAVRAAYPDALLARIDAARDSIRSGALDVPRVAFVEGEPGR
ncbi:MAG: BMP family protein [Gemmatimonadetes bacterium]|nr:BMP family protein [Gemmatimonadota bacterium]